VLEDLTEYKVLLFHDKHHHRHLLSTLRFCGLQDVAIADELQAAIEQIIANRFDLIMVTHYGEARETSDLLEELGGHDATSDIPILAFAKNSSVKDLLRILAKGVDEVLVEPISQEDVESTIRTVLQRARDKEAGIGDLKAAYNFIESGELDLAIPIFQQAMNENRLAVEAQIGLAQIAARQKDYNQAEKYLKSALNTSKVHDDRVRKQRFLSDVFQGYGQYYETRKQIKKAIKSYDTAFQLNPFNIDNMNALMRILQSEDDLDGLLNVIREVAVSYLPYSTALEEVAINISKLCDRFISLGMDDHAKKLFRELVKIKHEDADVHLQVTDFFLEQGEKQLVVKNLMEVSTRVKDADLLSKLGTIFLEDAEELSLSEGRKDVIDPAKAIEIARRAFHQAMLLDPDDISYRMGLVTCELRRGNPEVAGQILEKTRNAVGGSEKTYLEIIQALIKEKAWDMAETWLDEAEEKFPNSKDVSSVHASMFMETGQHYEAIVCLKKAMAQAPDDLELLLDISESYCEIGQFNDAVFYYEKAAKIAPKDERVKDGLRRALQRQ
jgi:tetratricopeptide (TPR) repeat protein